ncbi:MAG TPA: permease-like cell division protein FtsX [Tissierellaceae bacterium]|mgnify:CR=1 FL=1|nr:permease-like cell division protein FtsX [Tissierellaceae bacterium]
MRFRLIKNVIKQGFQGMWRNRGMGIASISSISAVLMILGVVLILILSINALVIDTQSKFDEIEIFLYDDASDEQMTSIEDMVRSKDGVLSILYKSKNQALDIYREQWGDEAYLLDGLETDNPLPNSYVIQLRDIEYADEIVDEAKAMNGVEKVNYHKEIIDRLMLMANYLRMGGIVIIATLVAVSIFIISNTIKITVSSRRREINIMKYVGATNGYIKGPFVIEGLLFGLIGAALSIALVYFGYEYFYVSVNEQIYNIFTIILVRPETILADIAIIFVAIGAGIGAIGSLVSMKRFLKV